MSEGEAITVTVPVTNKGAVGGKEIVQLYIGDEKAPVLRPVKELKHFDKISLAPGESKDVAFTITPDDLKFLTTKNMNGWQGSKIQGLHRFFICRYSRG